MIRERRSNSRLLWGGVLIALGAVLLVQTTGLVPAWAGPWFGAAVLAAIGLGFLLIYATATARWWALIPAGALFSLAIVAGVDPFVSGPVSGAIFLLGLSATFAVVAVAPAPCAPRTWAWIPAGVLAVLAALSLGASQAAAIFWPLVLIVAGAYLVVAWVLRGRQTGA